MQDQHNTQYIGLGKVKKVMVLKTSEEVKQTRTRERQRQRYQAMQQTMLKAVEQAVVLPDKQKASVERLCDPWDNSINEKLSRIRKSFCAEVHDSVADSYVIQGARGENRYISLDEELIELGDWGR